MADVPVKRLNFWNKLIVQDVYFERSGAWYRAVLDDLLWLHQTHPKCFGLPCPESDFSRWCRFVRVFPDWLKVVLHEWMPSSVPDQFQHAPVPGRSLTSESCHICNRMLKGKAALTQHLKKCHSIFPYEARFVTNCVVLFVLQLLVASLSFCNIFAAPCAECD